ncbi:MAG: nitrous oxide reductase accessory protein NosL [Chitinophagaceae bacterium]
MKKNNTHKLIRLVLLICAVAMVMVLFVPLWRIDLVAPQYPEGLSLLIRPDRLSGNVDIINGLNHYIGMKTLHTADFAEFRVLPWLIGFFALLFLVTAITGSRKMLYVSTFLFLCFGILAMYDFWKWEYNYGHNLNPDAAIVVPGMAYQPPLIGFRQLLNFSAYSYPAAGGWIFAGSGLLLLICTVMEWVKNSKQGKRKRPSALILASGAFLFMLSSCKSGTEPIVVGKDQCHYCKMTVSDKRFGAEAISSKGKVSKFDDVKCLLLYLEAGSGTTAKGQTIYFTNFSGAHELIPSGKALLMKSDQLRSPMGGNIAAFADHDSLEKAAALLQGQPVQWNELYDHE